MTEIALNPPYGFTIFCDDIRQEIGGKTTIIGTYQGYLLTTTLPVILSKFCTYVNYFEDSDGEIPELRLEIYFPDDLQDSPTFQLDVSRPPTLNSNSIQHLGDRAMRVMTFPIVHPPLQIAKEGPIKVRMRRGEDVVRLGMLYVTTLDRFNAIYSAEDATGSTR